MRSAAAFASSRPPSSLVVLVRQAEPLQVEAGHASTSTRRAVDSRRYWNGRIAVRPGRSERPEHVRASRKSLINDPVMVAIERGPGLEVGEPADVHRAAERSGPPQAFHAEPVGVLTPSRSSLQLVRPALDASTSTGRPNGKSIAHCALARLARSARPGTPGPGRSAAPHSRLQPRQPGQPVRRPLSGAADRAPSAPPRCSGPPASPR